MWKPHPLLNQQPFLAVIPSLAGGRVLRTPEVTSFSPQEKAVSVWELENFFFDLKPVPGAVKAVKQMANLEK